MRRAVLTTALMLAGYAVAPNLTVACPAPGQWGVWLTWGQGERPTVVHVVRYGWGYSVGVMLAGHRRGACDVAFSTDGRSAWVQHPRGRDDVAVWRLP